MKTMNITPYKIIQSKLFFIILTLLVLIMYSTTYVKYSIFINELTSLTSTNTDNTINYFMKIFTGAEFHVITRFFSIFFSLYVISFMLWIVSRVDEIIFTPPNSTELNFSFFTKSYFHSLYIIIFDLLFQTTYMNITHNEIPNNILPYYTGIVLILQTIVLLYMLNIKKNKLYITSFITIITVITIISILVYFSEVTI